MRLIISPDAPFAHQTYVERRAVNLKFLADNVRWGLDGTLLVAGQNGKVEDLFACFETPDAICTLGYTIAKLDPDTLEIMETISLPGTDVFGAATGAIQIGDELWVGTFRGNRVARIAAPEKSRAGPAPAVILVRFEDGIGCIPTSAQVRGIPLASGGP